MHVWKTFLIVLVAFAPVAVGAQGAALEPLQGRWVVTGGEHEGKPLDAIKGGIMTISGSAFEIRTASGNLLRGTLTLRAARAPFEMDMLHADGEKWEAIYAVEGETLKLNYVEAGGKDARPTTFTTSDTTEASLVVLRRDTQSR